MLTINYNIESVLLSLNNLRKKLRSKKLKTRKDVIKFVTQEINTILPCKDGNEYEIWVGDDQIGTTVGMGVLDVLAEERNAEFKRIK